MGSNWGRIFILLGTYMHRIEELIEVVKKKVERDQKGTWSKGSITYYQAIFDELEEVQKEMGKGYSCHLEDELGDIFWVYLCLLKHLEVEGAISMDNIFSRVLIKYKARVDGINAGLSWDEIKKTQKKALNDEQSKIIKV